MIITLASIILLLPLVTFAVMALTHHKLPRHGDWLATAAIFVSFLLSLGLFFKAVGQAFSGATTTLLADWTFNWLPMTTTTALKCGIMVDRLTAVMLVVVTLISLLVHLFSSKYMDGDVRYGRYYCCLLLFTFSMLMLVLADNMLFLFMGWEMVGLSSYLLIGHWFEKKSASNASIKAFITTRAGDVGMFIGIMIIYWKIGSLQYADIFAAVQSGTLAGNLQTIAGLGIFFGAMGKSAQFPLHVWLPDAMEGPTPVSALIHAATMVAAGVYLTGRIFPLFTPEALLVIAYTGAITAIFAASIALVQDDIKKVLAYSTVSQLGYMILALGVSGYVSGLFHLTTHAFFKACLFLGSGAVIHAMHHEQSMSKYGGLWHKMPKTAICYLLATLALCGVPPFSGFWSKDKILGDALAFSMLKGGHWFLPAAGFITAGMTAFYMFRQFFLTFTGKPRDHHRWEHAHDGPWQMLTPLFVLATLSVIGGGFGSKLDWFGKVNPQRSGIEQVKQFVEAGYKSDLTARVALMPVAAAGGEAAKEAPAAHETAAAKPAGEHAAAPAAHEAAAAEGEGGEAAHVEHVTHLAHQRAMALSIVVALLGIILGAVMYYERANGKTLINPVLIATIFKPIYVLLWNKYFFDELYMALFVMSTRTFSRLMALFDKLVIDSVVNAFALFGKVIAFLVDVTDRLVVDDWMVLGSARVTALGGNQLSHAQTGRVRQYLLFTVAGMVVLGILIVWIF